MSSSFAAGMAGVRLERCADGGFQRTELPAGVRRRRGADGSSIGSPGVGILLHAHPLHEDAAIRGGTRVTVGQVLGFLRIGMLLIPIRSTRDGVFAGALVADGALVGFGTPVFRLEKQ